MFFNFFMLAFLASCFAALTCEMRITPHSRPAWMLALALSSGAIPITLGLAVLAAVLGQ